MDSLGNIIQKRGRYENVADAELVRLNPSEKKRKAAMGKNLNNIEVEETSLNWSRLNR